MEPGRGAASLGPSVVSCPGGADRMTARGVAKLILENLFGGLSVALIGLKMTIIWENLNRCNELP